jgi:hypothetical protein
MIQLLRTDESPGFPNDYLLTRIKARRAALIAGWNTVRQQGRSSSISDAVIWEGLLIELEWLYGQMNWSMRECFAPIFVLLELKTIVLCLRNKEVGHLTKIGALLAHSLLSDEVQRTLRSGGDVRCTLDALLEVAAGRLPGLHESADAYSENGLRGFEDALMRGFLAQTAKSRLNPAVRRFFRVFIDARNVMILYKQLRWGLDDSEALIGGGTFELTRLTRALKSKDAASWQGFAREAMSVKVLPVAATEGSLESALLASLTRRLSNNRRGDGEVGQILDYIWSVYVHARNRAVLFHAQDIGEVALERELIV